MHYADYKTILSSKNGMNLYRGCLHGCIYCDSRSSCYHMEHGFEDIEVKRNAVEILDDQLRHKRKPCMISTGSMCDPYIPIEEELKITRSCLQIVEKHGFGLAILTKSTRILRDLDILVAINKNSKCVVQFTLTTYDEELCSKLEPDVSTTLERFHALESMRDAGIPTVVWLSPILPFINDTEENLNGIMDYCVKAGVRGMICFGFGMTLREGNREYYYSKLDELFPDLKERYIRSYGNSYACTSPNDPALMRIFSKECRKHGILHKPKEVFEYLQNFESNERQLSMFE